MKNKRRQEIKTTKNGKAVEELSIKPVWEFNCLTRKQILQPEFYPNERSHEPRSYLAKDQ